MHDQFKTAWGAEFRTLGPMASIRIKKTSLVYQQGGCRVQNSGPWDPWLPGVENGRLFAQRVHSAWCAPLCPLLCLWSALVAEKLPRMPNRLNPLPDAKTNPVQTPHAQGKHEKISCAVSGCIKACATAFADPQCTTPQSQCRHFRRVGCGCTHLCHNLAATLVAAPRPSTV